MTSDAQVVMIRMFCIANHAILSKTKGNANYVKKFKDYTLLKTYVRVYVVMVSFVTIKVNSVMMVIIFWVMGNNILIS